MFTWLHIIDLCKISEPIYTLPIRDHIALEGFALIDLTGKNNFNSRPEFPTLTLTSIFFIIVVFTPHVPVYFSPNRHNFGDIELKFCILP